MIMCGTSFWMFHCIEWIVIHSVEQILLSYLYLVLNTQRKKKRGRIVLINTALKKQNKEEERKQNRRSIKKYDKNNSTHWRPRQQKIALAAFQQSHRTQSLTSSFSSKALIIYHSYCIWSAPISSAIFFFCWQNLPRVPNKICFTEIVCFSLFCWPYHCRVSFSPFLHRMFRIFRLFSFFFFCFLQCI